MNRDLLESYRDKNVHIVGISGAEGFAIAEYLLSAGFMNVTCHDMNIDTSLYRSFTLSHVSLPKSIRERKFKDMLSFNYPMELGNDYLKSIHGADLVFAGQNWRAHKSNAPLLEISSRGVPIVTITQLYFGLSPAPIIAVTGTNGKTTTTNMITHIFENSGIEILSSGNDRYHAQVLNQLDQLNPSGFLILEISNRQLLSLEQSPHIAVLTNISHDHIEEHGHFSHYVDTKKKLFLYQDHSDYAVLNGDDSVGREIIAENVAQKRIYTQKGFKPANVQISHHWATYKDYDIEEKLFRINELKIPGSHNLSNAMAAAAAAHAAGISPSRICEGIHSFKGIRNRIEFIDEIRGIKFYNDSASTNATATMAALQSFEGDIILIIGGDIKGKSPNYLDLIQLIHKRVSHMIILPGTLCQMLQNEVDKQKIPFQSCNNLGDAMRRIMDIAKPGSIVLLSPAGAGFYSRFMTGEHGYRKLIRKFKRKSRSGDG